MSETWEKKLADRSLLQRVIDGHRRLPSEAADRLGVIAVEAALASPHDERSQDRAVAEGRRKEGGAAGGQLVAAVRVPDVALRVRELDDLFAVHSQRRESLPRSESGSLHGVASVANCRLHEQPLGVVGAAENHRAAALGATEVLGRGHQALEDPVEVELAAEARPNLLKHPEQVVGIDELLHQVLITADEAEAVEGPHHRGLEQRKGHRLLREVVEDAELHPFDGGVHVRMPGQHHELGVGTRGSDPLDELEPVHQGHEEVQHGDREAAVGRCR